MIICWCNCPTEDEARDIARSLVNDKLAACATIFPANTSIYSWEGTIEEESEATLMIKSTADNKEALTQAIQKLHRYEVPEIIFTDIVDGSDDYLRWLRESCR